MSWQSEEYKNGNPPSGRYVVECDLCGFDYYKDTLRRRRGLLVCHNCYDQKGVKEQMATEPEIGPTSAPRSYRRVE